MRALPFVLVLLSCGSRPEPAARPAVQATPVDAAADARAEQAEGGPWLAEERDAEHADDRISARHILVAFQGALRAGRVTRTREEARALAEEIYRRARAGEDFAALAAAHSDDAGTAGRGGFLGAFGHGAMQKDFEDAAFALEVGALSRPVESPFGFHVIRREPLLEARVAQILVQWDGAWRSSATRGKEEARARVEEARARSLEGEPFEAVARALSDGKTAPWGGDLGWFQKGQLSPALDEVAFELKPGQTSEIVETAVGFHLLHRLE